MVDLPAVARLINEGNILEALELFRETRTEADTPKVFGELFNGGYLEAAITLLKWDYSQTEDVEILKFLTVLLKNEKRYQEAEPFAEILCRHEPDYWAWYSIRTWARNAAGDPEGVQAVIAEAQEKIQRGGIDFQPSRPPNVSGIAVELERATAEFRHHLIAGGAYEGVTPRPAIRRREHVNQASNTKEPQVETLSAVERGMSSAILSGRIKGASEPGTWFFRYGLAANRLNSQTPGKPLPPGEFSEIRAPILEAANQWRVCATEHEANFHERGVRLKSPFGKDRNHLSGVGIADLLGAWINTLAGQGFATRGRRARGIDLRDGGLILRMKTINIEPKDYYFTFFTQAGFNLDGMECTAPWTLSGRPVDLESHKDGEWRDVSITFGADPEDWSFCGNNPSEQQDHARYGYAPLGDVLENQTRNFCFWMLFGDWRETPNGEVWFSEARLRYRDWNVLRNADFAELIDAPIGGVEDHEKLTDGYLGHQGDGWTSVGMAPGAKAFKWRFAHTLDLTDLVLHQHPVFPTRDCIVEIFDAQGRAHQMRIQMPNLDAFSRSPLVITLPEGVLTQALQISLLDGYHDEVVGLEAVEAFSDEWSPTPDGETLSVCEDVDNLPTGCTVYYRLCRQSGGKTEEGELQLFNLPGNAAPRLISLVPFSHKSNKAAFLLRGNAMGSDTRLIWWTDRTDPASIPFGHENTRQHRMITLRAAALEANSLFARLENDSGTSATTSVQIS